MLNAVPWLRMCVGKISALGAVLAMMMSRCWDLHIHIEELAGIHERAPEGRKEEEKEENCSILARSVVRGQKRSLQSCFTDQTHEDARQTNKHEFPSSKAFHEEGTEDVAGKT